MSARPRSEGREQTWIYRGKNWRSPNGILIFMFFWAMFLDCLGKCWINIQQWDVWVLEGTAWVWIPKADANKTYADLLAILFRLSEHMVCGCLWLNNLQTIWVEFPSETNQPTCTLPLVAYPIRCLWIGTMQLEYSVMKPAVGNWAKQRTSMVCGLRAFLFAYTNCNPQNVFNPKM